MIAFTFKAISRKCRCRPIFRYDPAIAFYSDQLSLGDLHHRFRDWTRHFPVARAIRRVHFCSIFAAIEMWIESRVLLKYEY